MRKIAERRLWICIIHCAECQIPLHSPTKKSKACCFSFFLVKKVISFKTTNSAEIYIRRHGRVWASITESFSFYCLAIDGWWKLGPYAVVQVPLDRATVPINVNIYSIPRFLASTSNGETLIQVKIKIYKHKKEKKINETGDAKNRIFLFYLFIYFILLFFFFCKSWNAWAAVELNKREGGRARSRVKPPVAALPTSRLKQPLQGMCLWYHRRRQRERERAKM